MEEERKGAYNTWCLDKCGDAKRKLSWKGEVKVKKAIGIVEEGACVGISGEAEPKPGTTDARSCPLLSSFQLFFFLSLSTYVELGSSSVPSSPPPQELLCLSIHCKVLLGSQTCSHKRTNSFGIAEHVTFSN